MKKFWVIAKKYNTELKRMVEEIDFIIEAKDIKEAHTEAKKQVEEILVASIHDLQLRVLELDESSND